MKRAKRQTLAVAVTGLLMIPIAGGGMASADPSESSHVDSMSAAAAGNFIAVSGGATFVDIPALVGEDGPGDAPVAGIGTDFTTITVARPTAGTAFKFKIDIADMAPAPVFGAPEVVAYIWPITVGTGDEAVQYELFAQRSVSGQVGSGHTPNGNPFFKVYKCVPNPTTGGRTCSGPLTTGTFANGVLEWNVSASMLGSPEAGTKIFGTSEIRAVSSYAGALWGVGLIYDSAFMEVEYTVPGRTVQLGIAAASTPPELVPLSENASVNATGAFSGFLPKPGAGSYVVVAKACYGPSNCGLSSTTITF